MLRGNSELWGLIMIGNVVSDGRLLSLRAAEWLMLVAGGVIRIVDPDILAASSPIIRVTREAICNRGELILINPKGDSDDKRRPWPTSIRHQFP